MGTQFGWFYDVAIAAVAVGVIYKCARKGFISSLAGFVGTVLSFALALFLSGTLAEYTYSEFVYKGVSEKITYSAANEKSTVKKTLDGLKAVDMSKALISGKSISELNLEPDSAGKVTLDLTDVDLSQTGIKKTDLTFFGIDNKTVDYKKVNLSKINIKAAEIDDIDAIILAKTVSVTMLKNSEASHAQLTKIMEEVLPGYSKATEGGTDLVAKMIAGVIKTDSDNLADAVNASLVKPAMIVPIRVLIFSLIFTLTEIIFAVIVKSLGLVNGIPVIGTVNTVLGVFLGILEAAVAVFTVCIGIALIISITGDNIIFLNTLTINQTHIFKHIYFLDFLDFKITV